MSVDTHKRILRAALVVFAQHGFAGASTRAIARLSGVHQPAIAYHFKGKEQLWRAAADAVFADFDSVLDAIEQHGTSQDWISLLVDRFIDFTAENPAWAAFIIHEGMQPGARAEWLAQAWLGPQSRRLYRLLTGAVWPGEEQAERENAISILGILSGASVIFAQRPQVLQFSGVDTSSARFIDGHRRNMVAALAACIANAAAKRASG